MKVYVLIDSDHEYRDGGNDTVVGVYRERGEAFMEVCKHVPDAKPKEGPEVTWEAPWSETFGAYRAWTIKEEDLR